MNKDMGIITVFYPTDSVVVAPVPFNKVLASSADSPAQICTTSAGDEYRIPNKEETAALALNSPVIGASSTTGSNRNIFTSSKILTYWGNVVNWTVGFSSAAWLLPSSGADWSVWCVKR